jgi:hypothetical protein
MKLGRIFNAVLLASALALFACATVPPPVTAFGHCTSAAMRNTSQGIVGHVMTALATGDYVAELAKLAGKFGGDLVGCAVDLVIAELTDQAHASSDPIVSTLLDRAQAWRGANP